MAAQQDVVAAARGKPMVVAAAVATVAVCFVVVAFVGRLGGPTLTMDELEAQDAATREAAPIARGDAA